MFGNDRDTWQETGWQFLDIPPGMDENMNWSETEWYPSGGKIVSTSGSGGAFGGSAWATWELPTTQRANTITAVIPDWAWLADDSPFGCAKQTACTTYKVGSVVHYSWTQTEPTSWDIVWVIKDANGNPFPSNIANCLVASEAFSSWTPIPDCFGGVFGDRGTWYPDQNPFFPYFVDHYWHAVECQPGTPCAYGLVMFTFNQLMVAWNICDPGTFVTKRVDVKYYCNMITWTFP